MQHVREGNLIAIQSDEKYYYFLILSKSAFFGCQWAHAFHRTSAELLNEKEILGCTKGFRALIDFIEPRRADSIVKISKKVDIGPFFTPSKLKARIDTYGGGHQWFIYSSTFSILKKQRFLMPWQKSYPIASGMKCNDAHKLIDKEWVVSQIVSKEGAGQYPFE